jgi:ATP-dependent helicase/nuclease subunit B
MKAKALRKLIGALDGTAEDDVSILITDEEQAAVIPWPVEQEAGGSEILKMQAACPFQCFATRRLAARPMDETDWGLEPRERGTAVHRILQGLWGELKSLEGLLAARNEGRLPAMIEQQVKAALQSYGKQIDARKRGWSRAYLDAEEERISSLIDEWLVYEEGRAPFTFEAGERKLPAPVGELKLQVRVDRIDGVRGGRVIIDYKTGKVKKDAWEGARPDEPQLLLYAGQVEELQGLLLGQVRAGEVKFIGRVEHSDAVMPGNPKLSRPPLSPKMLQQWHKLLLDVGQQFLNGEAQVDPKQYPKTCEYCKLPGLCRIAESDRANSGEDADDADD